MMRREKGNDIDNLNHPISEKETRALPSTGESSFLFLDSLIEYANSPPEEHEDRLWIDYDILTGDLANLGDLIAQTPPGESQDFLITLGDKVRSILYADIRKVAGAEGTIEDLRLTSLQRKPNKVTLNLSPLFPRVVNLVTQGITETHIHWPANTSLEEVKAFIIEEHTVVIMEMIRDLGIESLTGKSAYEGETCIYHHDAEGALFKLGKQPNPYAFALRPKFEPLIEETVRAWTKKNMKELHRDSDVAREEMKTSIRWNIEQIFPSLTLEYNGQPKPSGYLKRSLNRELGKIEGKQADSTILIDTEVEEVPVIIPAAMDPVDRRRLYVDLDNFLNGLDPIGRTVFENYYDSHPELRLKLPWERLSSEALGKELDRPGSTVRYHKGQIEKALGEILARYFQEEGD